MTKHIFAFRSTLRLAAVLAAMTSAACGKKDAAPVDTTTAASATPGATAPTAFSVIDIDMGRHLDADHKIHDKTDDFAPTDTMYASIHTLGAAANRTIVGRWTFQD